MARRCRAALLGAALLLPVALAHPAHAAGQGTDTGEIHDTGINVTQALLTFVLAPAALLVGIGLLAALPRLLHRPRYRPGRPWAHDPLWFAGPDDPDMAIAAARPARSLGGASAEW